MTDSHFVESAEFLLAQAKNAGFDVAAAALARWHRTGLLPRPRTRSLGRGRGTQTLYPEGTAAQLLALCKLHSNFRSLEYVGWHLWLQNHSVAEKYWVPRFRNAARDFDDARNKVRTCLFPDGTTVPSEQGLKELLSIGQGKITDPITRRMRKRVRTRRRDRKLETASNSDYRDHADEDFVIAMRTILDVALGQFRGWDSPQDRDRTNQWVQQQVILRALGLHRAREIQLPRIGPLLRGDIQPTLIKLSQRLAAPLQDVLAAATVEEIVAARDEWRTLLVMWDAMGDLLERIFGKHAFGFKNAGQFLRDLDPPHQAMAILLWHRFRTGYGEQDRISEIVKLAPAAAAAVQASSRLDALQTANPDIRKLLEPNRIRGALRNPKKMKSLTADLREILTKQQPDPSGESDVPSKS